MKDAPTSYLVLAAAAALATGTDAGSLTLIPVPGGQSVYLTDVSDDGRVVVGNTGTEYFFWTSEFGVVFVGGIAPGSQGAGGTGRVSADGTLLAGGNIGPAGKADASIFSIVGGGWTNGPNLGSFCDISSTSAWGMSADGNVVVGLGYPSLCTARGFRWDRSTGTIAAMQSWFGWSCRASNVSGDGNTVVGWQADNTGQWRPCFWRQSGTSWVQTRLPAPGGAATLYGESVAASQDGQSIVGYATINGLRQPFRWTQATGTVGLGLGPDPVLPGSATDCNSDASRVLCYFRAGPPPTSGEGYLWIAGRGYVPLETVAAEAGVTVPPEVHLSLPLSMSSDAKTIVGTGRNTALGIDVTFVLDLRAGGGGCAADLDGDGFVGGADLGLLLGAWLTPGPGDLNNDGVVDGADLGLLLGQWGPCP
ncbi:MAG: hypothetical protein FJ260_05790 [Planctomycetes bacterium]|nr:hypothetical protein [Planctomycetota bacterium]